MAYQGNAAYQLDVNQNTWEVPVGRQLSVHEGGGIDARTRNESSYALAALVKIVVVLTIALGALGAVRITLTSRTVSLLSDIASVQSSVNEAKDVRTQLQVERSILSATDRIQRIATENYGMVYASEVDTVTIETGQQASAEDAQSADVANAAAPVA